jgi:hypothetical protein
MLVAKNSNAQITQRYHPAARSGFANPSGNGAGWGVVSSSGISGILVVRKGDTEAKGPVSQFSPYYRNAAVDVIAEIYSSHRPSPTDAVGGYCCKAW